MVTELTCSLVSLVAFSSTVNTDMQLEGGGEIVRSYGLYSCLSIARGIDGRAVSSINSLCYRTQWS